MKYNEFSYANLNQSLIQDKKLKIDYTLGPHTYRAMQGRPGLGSPSFIFINRLGSYQPPSSQEGTIFKENELKFHISLPENDRDRFAKGWDIIKNILIDHNVILFKVVHEDERLSKEADQRGKDVTIYAQYNPEKSMQDWQTIFQEITEQLVVNNIPPGYATIKIGPRADLPIKNCNYVSYRYENQAYMDQVLDNKIADPCQHMSIRVDNQPSPQTWAISSQNEEYNVIIEPKS